jgi:protein-L-isoaspartate(D-aspartate) O-methyltransferase
MVTGSRPVKPLSRHLKKGVGMTSERTRKRLLDRLQSEGIHSEAVLQAINAVPRHLFVDEALASRAYEDISLPIGYGQTISQPFVVALMTQVVIEDGVPDRVLEVGTGCGYQTAILGCLVDEVFTVERIWDLHRLSRDRLFDIGLRNVKCRYGDGFEGWKEHAPYDAILAAAAPRQVPQPLLDQLTVGGRVIMPVGKHDAQTLLKITRTEDGYEREELDSVRFVPLVEGTS